MRLTACKPKPTIPNLIIGLVYLPKAIEVGGSVVVKVLIAASPPRFNAPDVKLTVYSVMFRLP